MKVGVVQSVNIGSEAIKRSEMGRDKSEFQSLINELQEKKPSTLSSSQVIKRGKLAGDVGMDFSGFYTRQMDKKAEAVGAARNQAPKGAKVATIDKTSELYEKCMALEGYFVKEMLSSMRSTVEKSGLFNGDNKMAEDMLYDEYATSITKNAQLGLADQMYLSLVSES